MPVYLSPTSIAMLTPECKALLLGLQIEIVDEDLRQESVGSATYFGKYRNWLAEPKPRIRLIDPTTGTEMLEFVDGTDYVIDYEPGEVTLTAVSTDIVRADYFFTPLNDTILERLLGISIQEVSNLLGRIIDPLAIPTQYQPAICKRLWTNVLKTLQLEYHDYFSLSVDGRNINKDGIPKNVDMMMKENEVHLGEEINALRLWNTVKRFE